MKNILSNDGVLLQLFSKKFLRTQRCCLLLFCVFFCSMSLVAKEVNTLNRKQQLQQLTLQQIFKELEKNSDYLFWIDTKVVKLNEKISISFEGKTVEQILNMILPERQLVYEVKGKYIVIKPEPPKPVIKERKNEAAQPKSVITGVVYDGKTKEPVIGANILVKDSKYGTLTNLDGEFKMQLPLNTPFVLLIKYLGYESKEVKINDLNPVTIYLQEAIVDLNEVQVIAYGAQKKVTVTGALSSIGTKDLLKSPSGSVGNILAGAVSGLSSVQYSGQPGSEDPEIFVRGTGSLSAEASRPLILVDGVERSFFQMDPNEIENITVLKDASATAVFGVRGANGVILVTTRRGEAGKMSISLSSQAGITRSLRNLNIVDSYNHGVLFNEAQLNDDPSLSTDQLRFSPFVLQKFKDQSDPIMFPSINWSDYLFKDFAWQTQHNLTLSGGTDRVRYFISLGYLYQDGILKRFSEPYDPNYSYSRYNYRSNVDIDITKTTLMKINIGGRVGVTRDPQNSDLWRTVLWGAPYGSPGIIDGKYLRSSNKYLSMSMDDALYRYYNWGYNRKTENVLNFDFSVEQNLDVITKGLKVQLKAAYNTTYSYTKNRSYGQDYYEPYYRSTLEDPTLPMDDPGFDNTIVYRYFGEGKNVLGFYQSFDKARDWYGEFSLQYNRKFGNHNITGLVLYNQNKVYYPGYYSEIPTAYVGLVGRATYDYKMKYLLDLNMGYNGSENFAPGKRYGLFPAISAGWVISEENFMKKQKVVDYLKLRASYGLVGNDKYSGERFLYLMGSWSPNHYTTTTSTWGSYNFGQYSTTMLQSAVELTMGNPDVTWESVAKQNYGVDLKMLKSRLSLTFDYFYEKRKDILSKRNTIPSIIAVELPMVNIGKTRNYGYEASLGWHENIKNVRYWATLNISYAKNEIEYMDEVHPNEPYMAQTGRSIGLKYGYLFDRFFTEDDFDANGDLKSGIPSHAVAAKPGDVKYKDLNGDEVVDNNDQTYFGYAERPEYVFGVLAGFEWKGFDFSMQWTGAAHVSRMLEYEYRSPFGTTNNRALLQYMADERWTPETASTATMPRFTLSNKIHNQLDSDLWQRNASYLRLKNAEIGYTFNNTALKKTGIQSLRLFVNGYNLFTISDLVKMDLDPEGKTGGQIENTDMYPNMQIFNFGVNVKF